MEDFSKCLASLINEQSITQNKLGKELNASRNQVHCWVKGKTEPKIDFLKKIARYFDVRINFLLGLEDEFGNKV